MSTGTAATARSSLARRFVNRLLVPAAFASAGLASWVAWTRYARLGEAWSHVAGIVAIIPTLLVVMAFEWFVPAVGTFRTRAPRRIAVDVALGWIAAPTLALGHALALQLPARGSLGALSDRLALATRPFAVQFAVALALSETIVYAWHRAQHRSGSALLWRIHAVHHRAPEMMSVTGGRVHPLDVGVAVLAIVAARLVGVGGAALFACVWLSTLTGSLHHADLDVRLGWFNWVIPGPEQHHAHHHIDPARAGNFATNLPLLDVLFGTAVPLVRPGEVPMGIAGDPERY